MSDRNSMRGLFAESGISYNDLNKKNLDLLSNFIDRQMILSEAMSGTLRIKRKVKIQHTPDSQIAFAGIRCKSHYFKNREAVSFNRDGFVGFAGWADNTNVGPILEGFRLWVDHMKSYSKKEQC